MAGIGWKPIIRCIDRFLGTASEVLPVTTLDGRPRTSRPSPLKSMLPTRPFAHVESTRERRVVAEAQGSTVDVLDHHGTPPGGGSREPTALSEVRGVPLMNCGAGVRPRRSDHRWTPSSTGWDVDRPAERIGVRSPRDRPRSAARLSRSRTRGRGRLAAHRREDHRHGSGSEPGRPGACGGTLHGDPRDAVPSGAASDRRTLRPTRTRAAGTTVQICDAGRATSSAMPLSTDGEVRRIGRRVECGRRPAGAAGCVRKRRAVDSSA